MGMTRARPSTSETLEGTARHPNHGHGQKIRLAEWGLATIREAAATELKGKYEEGFADEVTSSERLAPATTSISLLPAAPAGFKFDRDQANER